MRIRAHKETTSAGDPRVTRAIAEYTRLSREIRALEHEHRGADIQLLAALRVCCIKVEKELKRRGYRYVDGRWQYIG